MRFDWDDKKASANLRKHGVSFEDATFAFEDSHSRLRQDRIVDGEERWQLVGSLPNGLMLLTAFVIIEDDDDEIIRIISARKVTRHERRALEEIQRDA